MKKEASAIEDVKIKSGLEIHQQLNTGKLFCRCPGVLRQDKPDFSVERKLHAVAGESGEVDEAASHEAALDRKFIYEGYNDTTCLVELDEEPPHKINPEALNAAIQISLLLNCEILPFTQIMRKTVIDGSNTSGFQRTTLIARNGYVETNSGKVGISGVYLEEDAARIVSKEKGVSVYRLDRLGIPLLEISTTPDIKSAEQAKEVALQIGEVLRASSYMKRGIGTIRQDVNISVCLNNKWGERVEIKGVQDPPLIEKTVLKETQRQIELIKENESKSEVRKAEPDGSTTFLRPMPGAARMYPETDLPILKISREQINEAKKSLPKLKSEIKGELKTKGLSEEMIRLVLGENRLDDFKELLKVYENPNLVAKMLTLWQKEISIKENKKIEQVREMLTLDILESILIAVSKKEISEGEAKDAMSKVARGVDINEALKFEKLENLEEEILKIMKEKPGLTESGYMGLVMAKFKGKISGKDAMDVIKRLGKK